MMRSMANNRLKIMSIVGARPNMMKVAPLLAELRRHDEIEPVLVHTGQHYDYSMSQVFFEQLGVPPPDYNLDVGSAPHYAQTAEIMRKFGDLVQKDRPDMVLVAGDVNSTIACALVAAKERIPVAHVEAGLRSFDRSMPEEINRVLTDALSDLLFTTEESANQNLANEGVAPDKVFFVGNLMIDSLVRALKIARPSSLRCELGLRAKPYVVLTLHRPSNVDKGDELKRTLESIAEVAQRIPVVFPAHPRTARNIEAAGESAGLTAVRAWKGGLLPSPGSLDDAPRLLPGFSRSHPTCRHGHHGFRRSAGRDDVPRGAVPNLPGKHRAACDRIYGHKPGGRMRPATVAAQCPRNPRKRQPQRQP